MAFEAYSLSQSVIENGILELQNVNIPCTTGLIKFTPGSTTISINKCGIYKVCVTATVSNSTAESGNVTLQANNNGVAIPNAFATTTSASTTDICSMCFTFMIKVLPSCPSLCNQANLTFVNSGVAASYNLIDVNIERIV